MNKHGGQQNSLVMSGGHVCSLTEQHHPGQRRRHQRLKRRSAPIIENANATAATLTVNNPM